MDVSKEKLDIYVPAAKEGDHPRTTKVDNSIEGFRTLRDLARKAKATVCVESTGGYELELIAFMHKVDVAVAYADGLPEIGKLSDQKLNRLVGIAPEEKQSGAKEWHRNIWGGRKKRLSHWRRAGFSSLPPPYSPCYLFPALTRGGTVNSHP